MSKIRGWIVNVVAVSVFATSMLLSGFCNTVAFAMEQENSFVSSNYLEEQIVFRIDGDDLYFTKLPETYGFTRMIVSLYGAGGKVENKQVITGGLPARYNLAEAKEGTYHLQLYQLITSEDGKNSYSSYWYKNDGPQLVKDEYGWSVSKAATYEGNSEIVLHQRDDAEALGMYLEPSLWVDSDNAQIIAKAKEVTEHCQDDYDKVRAVHDWVAANVWYDYDYLYGVSSDVEYIASEVLDSKKSVCQGYADLCAAMLRAIGVPTKVMEGYALGLTSVGSWEEVDLERSVANHAWNMSYVEHRWVAFDATWDSGNTYKNGIYSDGTGLRGYGYFDTTLELFSNTHYYIDQDYKKLVEIKNEIAEKEWRKEVGDTISVINKTWNSGVDVEYMVANEEIATIDNGKLVCVAEGITEVTVWVRYKGVWDAVVLELVVGDPKEISYTKSPETTAIPSINPTLTPTHVPATEEPISEEEWAKQKLDEISLNVDEVSLYYGGNVENEVQVLYFNISEIKDELSVVYRIEDTSVASISKNGTITAKASGNTELRITLKLKGGTSVRTVPICVKKASIKISVAKKKVKRRSSIKINASATGVVSVKWKSSNKKIAKIISTGALSAKVTGVKKGTVTITAYAGKIKKTMKITVY